MQDFLKGLARALGPDVLGWPVDTAENLVNLGLVGGGVLGHKLGLLSAGQLPTPLQESPGTSEWLAKKAGVQGEGGAYEAGRFTPAIAGLGLAAAPRVAKNLAAPRETGRVAQQRGALRVGGDPDLIALHQFQPATDKPPPSELYSPSFAVTNLAKSERPVLSDFGGVDSVWLVPRIGSFSPREGNTALFNRDAFTGRYGDFIGSRFSEKAVLSPTDARARLLDRGLVRPNALTQNPTLRSPGTRFVEGLPEQAHAAAIYSSPRFQSFKHYEESPLGAALLRGAGSAPAFLATADLHQRTRSLLGIIEPGIVKYGSGPELIDLLRGLARNPEFPPDAQQEVRSILRGFAQAPSDYAELKVRGPVQISPERFAGAVSWGPQEYLQAAQDKWKIPVVEAHDIKEVARLVRQLQEAAPPKKSAEVGAQTLPGITWPANMPRMRAWTDEAVPPSWKLGLDYFKEFPQRVASSVEHISKLGTPEEKAWINWVQKELAK